MSGAANRAGADQLAALLGPDTIAAGEDPRRPVFKLSNGPPTMAVLPSADSATEAPCPALPSARADQLVVQLGPKTWSEFWPETPRNIFATTGSSLQSIVPDGLGISFEGSVASWPCQAGYFLKDRLCSLLPVESPSGEISKEYTGPTALFGKSTVRPALPLASVRTVPSWRTHFNTIR